MLSANVVVFGVEFRGRRREFYEGSRGEEVTCILRILALKRTSFALQRWSRSFFEVFTYNSLHQLALSFVRATAFQIAQSAIDEERA